MQHTSLKAGLMNCPTAILIKTLTYFGDSGKIKHTKSLIFLMLLETLMTLALLVLLQHIFLIPIAQPPCVMFFLALILSMVININGF